MLFVYKKQSKATCAHYSLIISKKATPYNVPLSQKQFMVEITTFKVIPLFLYAIYGIIPLLLLLQQKASSVERHLYKTEKASLTRGFFRYHHYIFLFHSPVTVYSFPHFLNAGATDFQLIAVG